MHYQEKIDQLFKGDLVPNRSLKTLLDHTSEEWAKTSLAEKEELLMKLYLSEEAISYYVKGYAQEFILESSHEEELLDTLAKSIRLLIMSVKDELIRASLLKIYVDLSKK